MPKLQHRTPLFATLTVASLAAAIAIAAPGAGAATGTGEAFGPDTVPTELHLQVAEGTGPGSQVSSLHWRRGGRYRSVVLRRGGPGDGVTRYETQDIALGSLLDGVGRPGALTEVGITRNLEEVSPDGYDTFDSELLGYGWPVIARHRAGTALLRPVTVAGRPVLRGTIKLASNECAGVPSGVRTIDLDPRSLVPVHVLERRGGKLQTELRTTFAAARPTDFAPVRVLGKRTIFERGFVRRSPAKAAELMPFPVSLPRDLPDGYRLAFTGSATRGNQLGPEASFGRSAGVFFARYSRGIEHIDFTVRGAKGTLAADWDGNDPFGGECQASTTTTLPLDASTTAHYETSEFGSPGFWWRSGTTLYTLSGPYSATQLATVARSLTLAE